MSESPEKQPQPNSGTGWLIGFGALFVGYLLGQSSAPSSRQPVYSDPSPPPLLATSLDKADTAGTAMTDMNATETEAVANDATTEETTGDTESTDNPASYAYAPTTTSNELADDPDAIEAAQVAQAGDDSDHPTTDTLAGAAIEASSGPWTRYQSANPAPAYHPPSYSYAQPSSYSSTSSKCESTGCYGVISNVTGLPRTTYVHGYVRKDGTYVRPYYRSRRR